MTHKVQTNCEVNDTAIVKETHTYIQSSLKEIEDISASVVKKTNVAKT